jgi:hypothetical protein
MTALYSILYGRFAALQQNKEKECIRLVYPVGRSPSILVGARLADCAVMVPPVVERVGGRWLHYGPFSVENDEFGRYAVARLALATTCLLGAKVPLLWHHRTGIAKWMASKSAEAGAGEGQNHNHAARAAYVANVAFDALARQRIRDIEGDRFYADVIAQADLLSATLLDGSPSSLPEFSQAMLALHVLGIPVRAPSQVGELAAGMAAGLKALEIDSAGRQDGMLEGDHLAAVCDTLYWIAEKIPGRQWHTIYLPYVNALGPPAEGAAAEIFRPGPIGRATYEMYAGAFAADAGTAGGIIAATRYGAGNDAIGQEFYFEMSKDRRQAAKIIERLERAARNCGASSNNIDLAPFGFPPCDYAQYLRLYGELGGQVRKMVEHARLVKNALDESTFEQSGNVDLQLAIQAVASQDPSRTDIFVRDENLIKNESWAVLVDSSLSLSGMGRWLRSVALCVAETAREIIGANPWGMFAFSDDLTCIKDFDEPYDMVARSRIGGMPSGGLSHIPDALRLARQLLVEHARERNYIILVSDGIASGYPGVEKEFSAAVRELNSAGVTLAAIGLGGSDRMKRVVPSARMVAGPAELAKAFSELYIALSS